MDTIENILKFLVRFIKGRVNLVQKEFVKSETLTTKPRPVIKKEIKWEPSPNFSSRRGNDIKAIILHHTGPGGLKATISWAKSKKSQISYHYVIDTDGKIYQLVKDKHKAWHAGVAKLYGTPLVNEISLGISLVGKGDKPFSEKQYKSLIYLCKELKRKYDIKDSYIVGHKDVAPKRKVDPAPFNLKHFLQRLNKE